MPEKEFADKSVERVVLEPGDWFLSLLKRRFESGSLSWAGYCAAWELRKKVLRFSRNSKSLIHGHRRDGLFRLIDRTRVTPDSFPLIINNFNRLASLQVQVEWLRALDQPVSIIILDNRSTYPPLLRYYESLGYSNCQVVSLGYNSGFEGIGDAVSELSKSSRYVVTDPDLVPYDSTPSDVLSVMSAVLDCHPELDMVGTSLEINDIPDCYPMRDRVQEWERRYWPPRAQEVEQGVFEGWIDTTFAMYRAGADVMQITPAARLDRPYTLKHVDWYVDPDRLTEEQRFYRDVSQPIASWTTRLNEFKA